MTTGCAILPVAHSYVQASECLYLRDKWYPEGEFYHVQMDPAAGVLTPFVAGEARWWGAGTIGSWDFSDPDQVGAKFTFETQCPDYVNGGYYRCAREVAATLTLDGTTLLWNESIPSLRTHVPWYRCELVPTKCVGKVRFPSLPKVASQMIFRRLMNGRFFGHFLLPVNRTHEISYPGLVMTEWTYHLGELRNGEWIQFRSEPWGIFGEGNVAGVKFNAAGVGSWSTTKEAQVADAPLINQLQPGLHTPKSAGADYDPVTQTTTLTLTDAPPCNVDLDHFNQPCIGHRGSYGTFYANPTPPRHHRHHQICHLAFLRRPPSPLCPHHRQASSSGAIPQLGAGICQSAETPSRFPRE